MIRNMFHGGEDDAEDRYESNIEDDVDFDTFIDDHDKDPDDEGDDSQCWVFILGLSMRSMGWRNENFGWEMQEVDTSLSLPFVRQRRPNSKRKAIELVARVHVLLKWLWWLALMEPKYQDSQYKNGFYLRWPDEVEL